LIFFPFALPANISPFIQASGVIPSEPIAGVRDFPPGTLQTSQIPPPISFAFSHYDLGAEEMRKRTWLFDKFREVARVFSFQEYDAPVLEYEELYTRFVPSRRAPESFCRLERRSPPFGLHRSTGRLARRSHSRCTTSSTRETRRCRSAPR
jgi:hypothetical protein